MTTFELVTLDGIKLAEEVYEVLLPTPEGIIAVFPHHAPIISLASPGVISVRRNPNTPDSELEHYATNGGVIEITDKRIRVLVDEATAPDEIVEKEIEEALKRAQEVTKEAKDQVQLDKAHALVQHYRSQLKVAELRKRKHNR